VELLTYESFINSSKIVESRRQLLINIFNQFEDIKPIMNEAIAIVELGSLDEAFEGEINEESIMAKMKDKLAQAVAVAKEKGKEALTGAQQKIIQLGGSIGSVIKLMIGKLKEWISAAFTAAKGFYAKAAQAKSADIKDMVSKASDDTKNLMIKEIGHLKTVTSSTASWVMSGFSKDATKAAAEAAKEDVKESFELVILESINEAVLSGELDFTDLLESDGHSAGIPFVSAIAHKMHHIPPFNLLDKVKQGAEKVASGVLNKLSYYATELAGAPGPFKFVALAAIIGIIAEVQFKGIAKHAVLHAVPGLGLMASIISNVAMALAVVGIVEALIAKKDGDEEGHDKAEA
jgi:hypothetical protein